LITKRDEVRELITVKLEDKLTQRGLIINDVNIINFKFSEEFDKAIEQKVKAEQEALKAEKDLERVKFEAQQQIEQSKAEAEKIRIQAEAITKQG
jgi:regulator of protease activity HflC (stomatin/prohibitin superfamily)